VPPRNNWSQPEHLVQQHDHPEQHLVTTPLRVLCRNTCWAISAPGQPPRQFHGVEDVFRGAPTVGAGLALVAPVQEKRDDADHPIGHQRNHGFAALPHQYRPHHAAPRTAAQRSPLSSADAEPSCLGRCPVDPAELPGRQDQQAERNAVPGERRVAMGWR